MLLYLKLLISNKIRISSIYAYIDNDVYEMNNNYAEDNNKQINLKNV